MNLITVQDKHIIKMMRWFESEQALRAWSGTEFKYPFDLKNFKNDASINELSSKVLVSTTGELLAFGQYYLRLGRCHLARLVVNPDLRGQGLVAELITQLSIAAKRELAVDSFSLFVMADNQGAIKAYSKLGFQLADYPETMEVDNCLYMLHRS